MSHQSRHTFREISSEVLKKYQMSMDELLDQNQQKRYVQARREIAVQMHRQGFSLKQIGNHLDRHHTSVLNMLKPRHKVKAQPGDIPVPDLSGEWAI